VHTGNHQQDQRDAEPNEIESDFQAKNSTSQDKRRPEHVQPADLSSTSLKVTAFALC
jgi:hypothetical protein